MLISLLIAAAVVLAIGVAYKLWKSNKAVTGAAVVAGVEAEVKTGVAAAESAVANTAVSKL